LLNRHTDSKADCRNSFRSAG